MKQVFVVVEKPFPQKGPYVPATILGVFSTVEKAADYIEGNQRSLDFVMEIEAHNIH